MVEIYLVNGNWKGDIKLDSKSIELLKKYKKISLFTTINFIDKIKDLKTQLIFNNFEVIISKADRAKLKGQVLGCDSYNNSFDKEVFMSDVILYVGDGYFHPDAFLFSQIYSSKKIPILKWNPVDKTLINVEFQRIKKKVIRIKSNLMKYLDSNSIGILVSTKPGQQNLDLALELKEKLNKEGKKGYIFLDDTFDMNKAEDFNFIDCWVNTACPRIGQEDCINFSFPIINIKEAFNPKDYLQRINEYNS